MHRFMLRLATAFLTFIIGIASAALAGNLYSVLSGFNTSYNSRSKVAQPVRVEPQYPYHGRSCLSHMERAPAYEPPARSVR